MFWFVVLSGIVCYSTHGFPHGGRRAPVKRSDYSMYDNQFFSVGDTKMDNEVTDCAIVRHQYARGYIRLREYLERMQGCGKAGRRKNMAGIVTSTKDVKDKTSDGFRIPSNNAVHVAPFKPRPIGQLIDNIDKKQSQVKAYSNQVKDLHPELPFQQHGLQRSQTQHPSFINLGFLAQNNRALSYKQNGAVNGAVLPVARKFISRKNLDTNPLQALKRLTNANRKQQYYMSPDPQRYYSLQSAGVKHAYNGPIAVGQPLLRPNPLLYPQQTSAGSKLRIPQGDQPDNPDLNMDSNNVGEIQKQQAIAQAANRHDAVPEPVKQVWQGKDNHFHDDFQGQDYVKDEATEIGNMQSDPIPSATTFTENPKLEEEKDHDSEQTIDDTSKQTIDDTSKQQQPEAKQTNKDSHNEAVQKGTFDGLAPEEKHSDASSGSKDHKPGSHDDLEGNDKESSEQPEPNKLDEFLKPGSNTNHGGENNNGRASDEKESHSIASEADQKYDSEKSETEDNGELAINLDVLKSKISSSGDIGFLKRMLTLIKKITHHKDFQKLAGAQKDAIVQAGKAVNSVVNKGSNNARSFIQPRPAGANPGTNAGYYRGAPSVNSYISPHPPRWKLGDHTATGSTHAQFYSGGQHQVSKKFQIERNPYQQRRVSYTPPYLSLRRINYGIYNGNVP